MKKSSKSQDVQGIIVKSPLIPLSQRGKLLSPPFGKGRLGGILKWLNDYQIPNHKKIQIPITNDSTIFVWNFGFWSLVFVWNLIFLIWCFSSLRSLLYAFSGSRYRSQRSPQQATT
jgi:hypothetical protein